MKNVANDFLDAGAGPADALAQWADQLVGMPSMQGAGGAEVKKDENNSQPAQAGDEGNGLVVILIIAAIAFLVLFFIISKRKQAIKLLDEEDDAESVEVAPEDYEEQKDKLSLAEIKVAKQASTGDMSKEELRKLRKQRRAQSQTEKAKGQLEDEEEDEEQPEEELVRVEAKKGPATDEEKRAGALDALLDSNVDEGDSDSDSAAGLDFGSFAAPAVKEREDRASIPSLGSGLIDVRKLDDEQIKDEPSGLQVLDDLHKRKAELQKKRDEEAAGVSSDESPTDESPTDESPTDESPTDETPADESPKAKSKSTKKASTEKDSTKKASTKKSSTKKTSKKAEATEPEAAEPEAKAADSDEKPKKSSKAKPTKKSKSSESDAKADGAEEKPKKASTKRASTKKTSTKESSTKKSSKKVEAAEPEGAGDAKADAAADSDEKPKKAKKSSKKTSTKKKSTKTAKEAPAADVADAPEDVAEEKPKKASTKKASTKKASTKKASKKKASTKETSSRKTEAKDEPRSLRDGLAETRNKGFVARLGKVFSKKLDDSIVDEMEEILFTADIGVRTSEKLLELVSSKLSRKEINDGPKALAVLREEVTRILKAVEQPMSVGEERPYVMLVVGVNGAGKTTTIGKVAAKLTDQGHKVLLVAGDTFRAAAIEQLQEWGERTGCTVYTEKQGSDPSGVIYSGLELAKKEGYDVVLADTAGRLHNKKDLVAELQKIHKVAGKPVEGAPHRTILVLDSTNGQNALIQAKEFKEAVDYDGIIMTKLDGTAKGGVIIGICDEMKLPVHYIGIGEMIDDLRPFDAEQFVEALF